MGKINTRRTEFHGKKNGAENVHRKQSSSWKKKGTFFFSLVCAQIQVVAKKTQIPADRDEFGKMERINERERERHWVPTTEK